MTKNKHDYIVPCEKLEKNWAALKNDPKFMESYGYIEWEILESFNHSSSMLQSIAIANLLSPLMSFIVPLLFFLAPFVLLRIQGIPISLTKYGEVLKHLAQHHFIGKALGSFEQFSVDKLIYMLAMFFLYGMQMYQNTIQCLRFYTNMQKINEELLEWKAFVDYEIGSMNWFLENTKTLLTYASFRETLRTHVSRLENLRSELSPITPFVCSIFKTVEVGYMLKVYYQMHISAAYEESILFSMGWEGYYQQMEGLAAQIQANKMAFAQLTGNEYVSGQTYPGLEDAVRNDVSLDAFMVITGPNASGKTTYLKSTALTILFSQQFGAGFYRACTLIPYQHIHSYLNIPDTSARDSLFEAESRRCKDILDSIHTNANDRHFCILDELYSGTNPSEATKSAYAFLEYLRSFSNVHLILTTHYVSICDKWEEEVEKVEKVEKVAIQNFHMKVVHLENKYEPTFEIQKGVSRVQGAIQVLENMDYPDEMIHLIRELTEEETAQKK